MKKLIAGFLSVFVFLSGTTLNSFAYTIKSDDSPGLLYEITGKDLKKPSYLFGTIHVICPNDMLSMDKLNQYLEQTDQLIMEIDMDNAQEMQVMNTGLLMSDGKTLKDFLTAEEFAKVDEMFKANMEMSVENLKQIKPFFLSLMISMSPKVLGCSPPTSYERSLLQAAKSKNKGIEGLETVSSQFAVLDKNPLDKQAKDLYKMSLDPQKAFNDFKKLIESYKAQNSDNLYDLIVSQMSEEKEFQVSLLDERNKNWIPKIEKAINEKPSFIAVGGGHLGGKNGVINLLRQQGYKIKTIKL
jgi:uncharacterized protein YbaP (TraB family)